MGALDKKQKEYFKDKRRFADAWNAILFGGAEVISWMELSECDSVLTHAGEGGGTEKVADLIMKRASDGKLLALLILENQRNPDYGIPARIFLEEALAYEGQVRRIKKRNRKYHEAMKNYGTVGELLYQFRKQDRLRPVVTLVLYWNEEEWDGPRSLEEMIDFRGAEHLRGLVPKYPIRIIDMSKFEDKEAFRTDLRSMVEFFQRRNDREAFLEYSRSCEEKYRLDNDGMAVLGELVKSKELVEKARVQKEKKEEGEMCKAITELIEEGKKEGIQIGMQQGMQQGMLKNQTANLKNLMDSTGWTLEQAMNALKIPMESKSKVMQEIEKHV